MNKLSKPSFKILFLALLAPIAIQGTCEPILTQNPAEHFVDGKLPPNAFRIANQIWELPSAEKLLARILADRKNPYLVRVGVMDNGVDIAHPDLVNQIDFGTDGKRITSAGFDVMGGDRFGSPAIMHLEYYAFGAEGIEGNRIKGAAKDPIALLKKYDRDFLASFIPKLKAHPVLGKSLYARFDATNFSIIGAQSLALKEFRIETYREYKSKGKLKSPNWKPKPDLSLEALRAEISSHYGLLFEPLELSAKGYPDTILGDGYSFKTEIIEDADVFHEFMKSEFKSFAEKSGYQKDFDHFVQFLDPRVHDVMTTASEKTNDAIDRLMKILRFSREGYAVEDPLMKMGRDLYGVSLRRSLSKVTEMPKARIVPEKKELMSVLHDGLTMQEEIAKYTIAHPEKFTRDELDLAGEYLTRKKTWVGLFDEYLARRDFDPVSLRKPQSLNPEIQAKYRKMLVRTHHPMIDLNGTEESHGSHVSGIIAKQNDDIRIVPLRVITRGTKDSPVKDSELLAAFEADFKKWMREPLVVRALEGRFSASLGGKKGEALVAELLKVYGEQIPVNFKDNKLDFRFLGEVQQAIEVAGRENLKLVNVSLGTTFDRGVIDYRNLDLEKQLKASFEFLKFEYLKWKVAETANLKAPNTLFLVATGNDGAWRDGRSKSALPVDLSSSFLADYEDASKGLLAPNNRVKNILGVGSLSQLDEISSYSNLLITKTPTVMARGEQVLSPIRPISNEATAGLFNESLSIEESMRSLTGGFDSERMDQFLIDRHGIKGTPEQIKEKLDEIRTGFKDSFDVISSANNGLKTDLFVRFPNARARYSGTSMATPTLTGLLANEINLKAKKLGIPTAQIYAHPEFSPTALIKLVQAKSEAMFESTSIIKLRKWTGEKLWEKSADEIALDEYVKQNELRKTELGKDGLVRGNILSVECERLLKVKKRP